MPFVCPRRIRAHRHLPFATTVVVALCVAALGCGDPARDGSAVDHGAARAVALTAVTPPPSPRWGLLANAEVDGRPVKATFFFAGNWKNGVQWYEYPPGNNIGLYTYFPLDPRHLGWSESVANRDFALDEMLAVHLNVINMSSWGPRGTDTWAWWAPMQTSTSAHDELFEAATSRALFIQPVLEVYAETPTATPAYFFKEQQPTDRHAMLLKAIEDLVTRYITDPKNPRWESRWAKLYDREGQARYAIHLFDVYSTQIGADEHERFADGLEKLAARVEDDLGVKVGFTLDVQTPKPREEGAYYATPEGAGPFLRQSVSVLAIQPFRDEIAVAGGRDSDRIAFKRSAIESWVATGIPVILDVTGGYDGHIVFPGTPTYGSDDVWRNDQSQLKGNGVKGITFSAWNGFTEGWYGMTVDRPGRDGTPADTMNRWLRTLLEPDPRVCDHWQYVNGIATFHVFGEICKKWYQFRGTRGALGAPVSDEHTSCRGRRSDFQFGVVLWSGSTGAHEVHGLIAARYLQLGADCSWLGLPTSDEIASTTFCPDGRASHFEFGIIDWCPGWPEARERSN